MFVRYPNGSAHICNIKGPPDPITGLLEEGCKYYPYPYHNRGTESLMDHQWIKEVLHGQFEFPNNIFYTSIKNILILHTLCLYGTLTQIREPGDSFTKVIVNRKSKITLKISLRAPICAFH